MKIDPKKLEAKVQTLSNYRGMNGYFYSVTEIVGRRVTVIGFDEQIQRPINIDFSLNEILEFKDK